MIEARLRWNGVEVMLLNPVTLQDPSAAVMAPASGQIWLGMVRAGVKEGQV